MGVAAGLATREAALPIYSWQSKDKNRTSGRRKTPAALAAAVRREAQRTGRAPATVAVPGVGTFVLEPPARRNPRARLPGVIALVTGAAQGIGLGIATELAAEGARVVLADVNAATGEKAAAALNVRFGRGTACFATCDVSSLASTREACAAAVHHFGGLDLLVSNAGVLKAGGIEDLDEAAFDLVTAVNYKGFFLCVKAATPILRAQHALHPAHGMDIIQINSKSGLEGSNRNFAYAGGKFGGIGLVQSFALELVPDGIKVNAICPGNYFDGPLWSDPEKGLFVQYLRAGKVAGARTIADVRAAYTAKVPMGRGVTPLDIARAIVYLREQQYETGQALPVTGGQVMLR
jgi:NAD(P)-dependent dehydrogenase (short-subunit alcohol dehydrogenase family)